MASDADNDARGEKYGGDLLHRNVLLPMRRDEPCFWIQRFTGVGARVLTRSVVPKIFAAEDRPPLHPAAARSVRAHFTIFSSMVSTKTSST
jgi:hypothetical protein